MTGSEYLILAPISAVLSALITVLSQHVFRGLAGQGRVAASVVESAVSGQVASTEPRDVLSDKATSFAHGLEQSAALLRKYDAHWWLEARRTSAASLISSMLGALLVVTVLLVAFRSHNPEYTTVVVSLTGAVTSLVTVLFHRQSKIANAQMERQAAWLRQQVEHGHNERRMFDLLSCMGYSKERDLVIHALLFDSADAAKSAVQDAAESPSE
ncbi:MAG TPA: hypothetical protein VH333_14295 [Pseudonocardiaceae bacterium]|nr:hypothetical protein [Pseudonocardiaceae bacterium]